MKFQCLRTRIDCYVTTVTFFFCKSYAAIFVFFKRTLRKNILFSLQGLDYFCDTIPETDNTSKENINDFFSGCLTTAEPEVIIYGVE